MPSLPWPTARTAPSWRPPVGDNIPTREVFIVIRDADTGKVRGRIAAPEIVYALAFDPKGERLATGDAAGKVTVWDLATSRPAREFVTGSSVHSIVYLDRPRRLVTHGKDAVLLIDLESGKQERKVDLAGGGIRKLVADPSRDRLVVGFESGAARQPLAPRPHDPAPVLRTRTMARSRAWP